MMKRNVLSLILLLLIGFVPVDAQTIMKVHLTDGTVYKFSIAGIDHIDWDDESATFEDITYNGTVYKLGMSGAIDLGLSVKWAAVNIGATVPGAHGDYYAWGETETKSNYSWSTYLDSPNRDGQSFTKYASDKETKLNPEDDVAHVKWGGEWRMPTKTEMEELREKCTWVWLNLTDHSDNGGYVVIGSTGNAIFLPAAGHRRDTELNNAGIWGNYWSSSLNSDSSRYAYFLDFGWARVSLYDDDRFYGYPVRPVCP